MPTEPLLPMRPDSEPDNVLAVEPLLTLHEAAKTLAVSESWLWQNTAPRGAGIRCVKLGRSIRYDPRDLREYIDRAKSP